MIYYHSIQVTRPVLRQYYEMYTAMTYINTSKEVTNYPSASTLVMCMGKH